MRSNRHQNLAIRNEGQKAAIPQIDTKDRMECWGPRRESKSKDSGMECMTEPGDEGPDHDFTISQRFKARDCLARQLITKEKEQEEKKETG